MNYFRCHFKACAVSVFFCCLLYSAAALGENSLSKPQSQEKQQDEIAPIPKELTSEKNDNTPTPLPKPPKTLPNTTPPKAGSPNVEFIAQKENLL